MTTIKDKMNHKFRNLEGGLFLDVSKADVGSSTEEFFLAGGDNMAWADMFYPDPSIPLSVKKATLACVEEGSVSHYTLPIGLGKLREAVAKHVEKKTGLSIDPNRNVVITPGSDSGLLFAMMPFIEEGDEVLIFDPSYPSNFLNVQLLGGIPVSIPTRFDENYQISIEELEKRVTPKTKMVVLTHPNNPTTVVYRKENLIQLTKFIVEHDLVLVCDQAFEDHIYDGIEFVAPCTLPGMWERTVTVCSLSKGYGLSGYRIGYIYTNDVIMDVLYAATVNVCGAPSTISTYGAIAALEDASILPSYTTKLEKRQHTFYEMMKDIPGVKLHKSESGILAWLDIHALGSSQEVAQYIMKHANIMVNEGTPYGKEGEGYIRIVSCTFYEEKDAILRYQRIKDALIALGIEKGF